MRSSPWFSTIVLLCTAALSRGADITWTNIGPGGGGWIQAIACDPRDAETIYLGCDVGGFYISRDAGRTWHIQNDGLNNYFVESIAVHPDDSKIILLGMEGGIFKSADQGNPASASIPTNRPGCTSDRPETAGSSGSTSTRSMAPDSLVAEIFPRQCETPRRGPASG